MRIAMISEHASPLAPLSDEDTGGQSIHVAELARALATAGHDVRVYTRRDAPDPPDTVGTSDGYAVVHVPAGPRRRLPRDRLLPHLPAFGRWLGESWQSGDWAPDVAHAHFWMSGIAAVAARQRLGVPVVLTYHALGTVKRRHQGPDDPSPPERVDRERELGATVDRVVAQSRGERDELHRMGVRRDRVAVVPSGVDSSRFSPGDVANAGADGPRRILTVGRLVERKGFADVVRALGLVPGSECVVIGGPPADQLEQHPLARRLWKLAADAGVTDRVRLVGAVPPEEMPAWYRSADVLAAAPWYEPFGLVPLEAMACGVPVVASAVGGLTDTVVHEVTGTLVPPRNPRALGLTLRRLLGDEPRRFAYGVAALDRARQRYSWQRAAEQLTSVYESVSRQGPG